MLINTILVEQTIEREGVWERLNAKIFEHRHRCFTDTSIFGQFALELDRPSFLEAA